MNTQASSNGVARGTPRPPPLEQMSLLGSRPQRIAVVAAAAFAFGIGWLPLLSGPGYEFSLVAGLLLPSLVAIATAYETSRTPIDPESALFRGMTAGALVAGVAGSISLFHAIRVGPCDLLGNLALYALGPAAGTVLGGAWGGAVGSAVRRLLRRGSVPVALLLAWLGPATGVVLSVWRFDSSPMVFAFDPFFGFFAGPIYETIIEPVPRLLTYRAGTLLSVGAAAVLLSPIQKHPDGWTWEGFRRPGLLVLGGGLAIASILHTANGAALGHFSTVSSIREALGSETLYGRCTVVYSSVIERRQARLLASDCSAHLRQIEEFFGASGPPRITVYLFASSDEKAALVGAAVTEIAKPWRAEIYLANAPYPHPVLGHELAHVVAGRFGRGPFRIAGALGGWLPDPGLIEGVAVAASPSMSQPLTPEQWARAMQKLGLLPRLQTLFGLGFLGQSSSRAYTVAGAFLGWFRDRYGPASLRSWYGGASLPGLTGGLDLSDLEQIWLTDLEAVPIDARALGHARLVFSRPSVFERRCPHVIDRENREGWMRVTSGDIPRARRAFDQVLALMPAHLGARFGLAACSLREGDESAARRRYSEISHDGRLTPLERSEGSEDIADLELWNGSLEAARLRYRSLESLVFEPDRLRRLDIKLEAGSEAARRALTTLLMGDRLGRPWPLAVADLSEWAHAEPGQGIAYYLLAKNFYVQGYHERASSNLDRAFSRALSPASVEREAWRLRVFSACALGDRPSARRAYAALAADPDLGLARRRSLARFAGRCGI